MYTSPPVLNSSSNSSGVMIILARRHLGLGALIHSAVNSIWLAKKLGKVPYIWWGKSCLYTDLSLEVNTYSQLFQEPQNHLLLSLAGRTLVYPSDWNFITPLESIQTLDERASLLTYDQSNLDFKPEEHDLLVASDICIVCQYLYSDLTLLLANLLGVESSIDEFITESNEIFAHYFQPQQIIQSSANEIWEKTFAHQQFVIGIHLRGTDKIIETALPSPRQYVHAIKQLASHQQCTAFFIATDSQPMLKRLESQLMKLGTIGTQDIVRSSGTSGLHFSSSSKSALKNGIEMIIDMELLCKCKVVIAFPGSQIFWWLSRKRDGEKIDLTLLSVKPSFVNWVFAVFFILRTQGWNGLIQFLRLQKGGIKSLLISFLSKNSEQRIF